MKNLIGLLALMASFTMQAQKPQPVYENEGQSVKATFYHENGAVAQVGTFLNGKLHGEWVMYDATGNKQALGQYDNGVRVGKWFFWEEEMLREVDFSDNRIVNVVNWNNSVRVAENR